MSNFLRKNINLLIMYFLSIISSPVMGQTPPPETPPPRPPGPHREIGGIEDLMVPPDALLKFQEEIALSEEQKKKIRSLIKESESEAFDLKWKLEDSKGKLQKSLNQFPIDEATVKKHSEALGQTDQNLKTNHLLLLVRLRNLLSAEQYQKIRALKPMPPPPR